jgi:putative DNA primase/helicase
MEKQLSLSVYDGGAGDCNRLPEPVISHEQSATETAAMETVLPAPQINPPVWLELGSDIEIAKLIAWRLKRECGTIPHSEGQFWRYIGTHWEPIPREELRRHVHECDGLYWGENARRVRLNKNRLDSIINELGVMLSEPAFFAAHRLGINCLSGFISFDEGSPRLLPHDPEHRQRHVLQGRWQPGAPAEVPEGSLLARLLRGCFLGDPDVEEKLSLIAEIAGAAALGHGPQHTEPKAAVLLGRMAGNGKSQILDLLRGLLPVSAVSSVPPTKFADDKHLVKLVGKLLNTSDELGTAKAIASEAFKAIITGEPVTARDLYVSAIEFRPQAQHVFACNQLPAFNGGMDRGVQRRLMPIVFNRTIPREERIPHIGQRIVEEELDLVLAFAVDGATRLLERDRFPELASSREALEEWAHNADPVQGWIEDRLEIVTGEDAPRLKSSEAYADFRQCAIAEGHPHHKLPHQKTFTQRVTAALASKGVEYKHSGDFRGFLGARLRRTVQ